MKPRNAAGEVKVAAHFREEKPGVNESHTFHYLPTPENLLQSDMYVTSTGQWRIAAGETYPPARHPSLYHFNWQGGRILPEFGLILISAGKGTFESLSTGLVKISPGDAFLLFPGIWHRYRPDPETGWDEKWVQFNGELPHKLLKEGLLSPKRPVLRPADAPAVERSLNRVLEEVDRNLSANSLYLSLLAMGALTAAIDREPLPLPKQSPPNPEVANDPITASAIAYIWTRSNKVISVDDVAANVRLSRRTLERHMMDAVGHSVLDEIIQCRFSRAERLVRETKLPIKVIVSLSGFGSMQNMRHVFLKRRHVTPSEYRIRNAVPQSSS